MLLFKATASKTKRPCLLNHKPVEQSMQLWCVWTLSR